VIPPIEKLHLVRILRGYQNRAVRFFEFPPLLCGYFLHFPPVFHGFDRGSPFLPAWAFPSGDLQFLLADAVTVAIISASRSAACTSAQLQFNFQQITFLSVLQPYFSSDCPFLELQCPQFPSSTKPFWPMFGFTFEKNLMSLWFFLDSPGAPPSRGLTPTFRYVVSAVPL